MRLVISLSLTATVVTAEAWAQGIHGRNYPDRPIRLIVPFAPGGGSDVIGRTLAHALGQSLGQQVIVDNRSGANGAIGAEVTARASPDGYTLLMATPALALNTLLLRRVPYDHLRDFVPISRVASAPLVLTAPPTLPARDLRDLIALAKSRTLNYASSGSGSLSHMAGELFKSLAGIPLAHVPFKGSGPALAELIGGNIQLQFADVAVIVPHVRSGKVRPLGVTGPRTFSMLPGIPPIAAAVPGYEVLQWYGLVGPARIHQDVVVRIAHEVARSLRLSEIKRRFEAVGVEPDFQDSPAFADFIRDETSRYAKTVKTQNLRLD
jgi:tripartite-type tricarboxylate transporter receptor subunit TctC